MKSTTIIVSLLMYVAGIAGEKEAQPDYLNPDLPFEVRVDDLVSRMTLEEKVSQMMDRAKAISRLNIPEYNWWNECLHGVARAGRATVFPQAIGLAATWNTELMFELADVISTEARAKHHEALQKGDHGRYKGLTYWSPNINIFRDPRWGRGQETYGEDPYLTARMAVAFIKGLQGDHPKYYKLVATAKHYAVHSGPEPLRHEFDAVISKRDLYDTYLPAFKAAIKEAKAYSVMCAYNRYLGDACCGSPALLKDILRRDWDFQGYIVSDCWAIRDFFQNHHVVDTAPEAAALAVKTGTDLNCGNVYDPALLKAAKQGLISEEEIDVAVKRLFLARFKLGMFDPPGMVPYAQIPIDANDSEAHRKLSVRAAQESIVLLKNENRTLPLSRDLKKIAVIGPTANSYEMLLGNYNGIPSSYVTPLQGIRNKLGDEAEVLFEQGCNLAQEGPLEKRLTTKELSSNGKPGLKAEYFKSTDLSGQPFHTLTTELESDNWIWGKPVPGLKRGMDFSVRWTGVITPPATGRWNFKVQGDDGYRLFINGKLLVESWQEQEMTTTANDVHLEEGKSYDFKLEFFQTSGRPHLSVSWELLGVDHFGHAIELAKSADAVIFVGGLTAQLEGEEMPVDFDGFKGGDRTKISLPKVQRNLLKALHQTGKPIVLVLTSGSALAVNWAAEHLPAIVELWYPGQEGGTALADVLFGDYNPAGRLPVTLYKSVEQLPPFEDYHMKGRTYRYFEQEPLFSFGHGLSYTKFEYKNLVVPEKVAFGSNLGISVQVENTGEIAGDEVVQLYIKDLEASVPVPLQSLQGLKRIHLAPGESKLVEFTLSPEQMSLVTEEGKYVLEPGVFVVSVGGSLPGEHLAATASVSKEVLVEQP